MNKCCFLASHLFGPWLVRTHAHPSATGIGGWRSENSSALATAEGDRLGAWP